MCHKLDVAVCCSVLQCVAVYCSVLQCVEDKATYMPKRDLDVHKKDIDIRKVRLIKFVICFPLCLLCVWGGYD